LYTREFLERLSTLPDWLADDRWGWRFFQVGVPATYEFLVQLAQQEHWTEFDQVYAPHQGQGLVNDEVVTAVAASGNLGLLQRLVTAGGILTQHALGLAARHGHLAVLEWAASRDPTLLDTSLFQEAAKAETPAVFEWLKRQGVPLPRRLRDLALVALSAGRAQTFRHIASLYLRQIHLAETELALAGNPLPLLMFAARHGLLDIVEELLGCLETNCLYTVVKGASLKGQLHILQWVWHTYKDHSALKQVWDTVWTEQPLHITQWALDLTWAQVASRHPRDFFQRWQAGAWTFVVRTSSLYWLERVQQHAPDVLTYQAKFLSGLAGKYLNWDVVDWLQTHQLFCPTSAGAGAVAAGHDVPAWPVAGLEGAIKNNHVKLLVRPRITQAFHQAVKTGTLSFGTALKTALAANHPEVVRWLRSEMPENALVAQGTRARLVQIPHYGKYKNDLSDAWRELLDVVKPYWLQQEAVRQGRFNLLKWTHRISPDLLLPDMINGVAKYNPFPLLPWIWQEAPESFAGVYPRVVDVPPRARDWYRRVVLKSG